MIGVLGEQAQGRLGVGEGAGRLGAPHVEGVGVPNRASASARSPMVDSKAAASSASASMWIARVPCSIWSPSHTPRVSAARRSRSAARSGSKRFIAAATSASTRASPIRCATGASWAST